MLWGDALPATWEKALRVLMTKLRAVLEECGIDGATALTSAFGCYQLTLPAGAWVDVDAAGEALERAEAALAAGDLGEARSQATVAAALARRSFLPGEDSSWVEEKRRDLRDVLVRSLECLRDAWFGAGEFTEAVRHAEEVTELEPFRESGYRRLMEAHAVAGNPAEALRVYERCRRFLAEELGAYPSPETEAVHRKLLQLDSGNGRDASSALVPAPTATPPPRIRSRRRLPALGRVRQRRRALALTGAAALVAAVATATWLVDGDGNDRRAELPGDSVVAIDQAGNFGAPVAVGATPSRLAVGEGALWVGSAPTGTVRRIDPDKGVVVQTIALAGGVDGLAAGHGSVWATSAQAGTLVRINPETNSIVQSKDLPNGPRGIAVGEGAVWVVGLYARTITRIDPDSGRPLWTRRIGGSPIGVAAGEGAVWVSNESRSNVTRIDPRSGRVIQPVGVSNAPGAIAVGTSAVWVANTLDGTVSRINPATNAVVATVGVGEAPAALAVDDEGVWVASELAGTIVRIDARTNDLVAKIGTGQRPVGVALDGRRLWVAARDAAPAHRGGTLRVADSDFDTAELRSLTGDGLTAYRRVGGTEGARVVPDLAVSMPTVSEGGKTYTFQLRGGIRYSTGETVGPADFRRAIERFYRLGPPEVHDYDTIVGAAACRRRPATCDLSRGIVADTTANTVTFHLTRPNPNLIHSLALPFAHAVAPSAPRTEATDRGLPATGPYMVASRRPGELRFVRNPWFREWSRAARPDGYPDEIVATVAPDDAAAVSAIEQGRLDTLLGVQLPPALLERLAVRYPSRLHVDPLVNSRLLVALNTTRPPFDRIDARRAVAYALDREELVRIGGGPHHAEVACQVLPPNFPAHRAYCPYTPDPGPDGAWRGPDLLEAKRLVGRSGTAGATVVVRTPPPFSAQARYVAGLLRRLGYRASARVSSPEEWQADAYGAQEGATPVQVGLVAWFIGYPAPSQFFEQLRCGAPDPARFCSPAIDRLMDEALALQTTDPAAADKLWERVDRALTDQAAWIPYATPRQHRLVSKRVGNHQSHPVWGTLLDQMWVR